MRCQFEGEIVYLDTGAPLITEMNMFYYPLLSVWEAYSVWPIVVRILLLYNCIYLQK